MDFVFRGFYQRSSSGSQSSNYTYFSQRPNQCDVESYNGGRYDHFLGNRDVMMERQLEKEMIRREILAEKAAMRRELEAEVRRELREEREFELRKYSEESDFRRRGGDPLEASHRNCYVERRSFEKRAALPVEERMYDFPRLEEGMIVRERMYDCPRLEEGRTRGYEKEELPFQRAIRSYEEELPFQRAPQAIKSEAKPPSDEENKQIVSLERKYDFRQLEGKIGGCEKDVITEGKEIIYVAKPDANYPGKKRKDISSTVDGPSEVTKKLTKEWTCALCRISATSELGLEDHLKGKKHKSKQAGQKTGMIGLCSKKINDTPNSSQVVESVELEKSQQITNKHETGVENNKAIVMEKGCGGPDQKMPKKKRMNFKFYCKICEVGAFCEEVMANHKKGKKHSIRLHQLGAKR